MSVVPFSFNKLFELYDACESVTVKNNTVKALSPDLKSYLHTYFFQTTNNNYLFYDVKQDI